MITVVSSTVLRFDVRLAFVDNVLLVSLRGVSANIQTQFMFYLFLLFLFGLPDIDGYHLLRVCDIQQIVQQ